MEVRKMKKSKMKKRLKKISKRLDKLEKPKAYQLVRPVTYRDLINHIQSENEAIKSLSKNAYGVDNKSTPKTHERLYGEFVNHREVVNV